MSFFTSKSQIAALIGQCPAVDGAMQNHTAARQAMLTKPPSALGRLEDIAIWMAGWQRQKTPSITHGQCLVFNGNQGLSRSRYLRCRRR